MLALALGALVLIGSLAAVLIGRSSPSSASHGAQAPTRVHASGDVHVIVDPPNGTTGLPLDARVSVAASGNTALSWVSVVSTSGHAISGALDSQGRSWESAGTLGPHTRYNVTVTATLPSGRASIVRSSFSTLQPTALLAPRIFPGDGTTVGIGQPIKVVFNTPVQDRVAVTSRLVVSMSAPVPGAWHWFSDREVHYRPENYWPTGEHVAMSATLSGVDAGNGVWGVADHSVNFVVGDAHVSTADTVTHQFTVTDNGAVVKTFPMSAGRTKYPSLNGIHAVLGRQQDVLMDSATVGIPRNSPDGYYEHVFWDVAITAGGEYVHAAPWSTGAQGRSNVSHGCINLGVANAIWFYNFSLTGDIVQVTGSPRQPTLDPGTADWNTPWSTWTST
jgi:lipoprotein-anchoring transpeptidase ErfK/SrfK